MAPRDSKPPDRAPRPERQAAFLVGLSAESRAAAEAWLADYADEDIRDIRFDAMLVAPGLMPRHIPAAFDVSLKA